MNMQPVHYAPHHTGHLPLCGAEPDRATNGGVVICTLKRDLTTCFPCIDQYEERVADPAHAEAITENRSAVQEFVDFINDAIARAEGAKLQMDLIEYDLKRTKWWQFKQRAALKAERRAVIDGLAL